MSGPRFIHEIASLSLGTLGRRFFPRPAVDDLARPGEKGFLAPRLRVWPVRRRKSLPGSADRAPTAADPVDFFPSERRP